MSPDASAGPQLRDIHLPAEPSWWPPAPGWWILGALLALFVLFALYKLTQLRRRRRRKQRALAELNRCIVEGGSNPVALAAGLSQFLRRMALRESAAAAALSDARWLAWLDARTGGDEFANGVGRVLLDAPYRPVATYDAPALIALVRRWTRIALATESTRA
jgi:hypothetical protein